MREGAPRAAPAAPPARVVLEAHRTLLALARRQPVEFARIDPRALGWLTDRKLIEGVMGERELEYEITPRGRRAVLGDGSGTPP